MKRYIKSSTASRNLVTNYLGKQDIDLSDKLENMVNSEISEEIYSQCTDSATFKQIEDTVWQLMSEVDDSFSAIPMYVDLANEYIGEAYGDDVTFQDLDKDEQRDALSAGLYNCDWLYMTAIAMVLGLDIPQDAGDVDIFGM